MVGALKGMHTPEHDLAFCIEPPLGGPGDGNGEGPAIQGFGSGDTCGAPNSVGFTWAWHDETATRAASKPCHDTALYLRQNWRTEYDAQPC